MLTYWYGIPAVLIGVPATALPIFVWYAFARTPKGRR